MSKFFRKLPLLVTSGLLAVSLLFFISNNKKEQTPEVDHSITSKGQTSEPAAPLSSAELQIFQQVPLAKKILADWRADNPQTGQRKLHIVYWTPADKEPAERYQQRLQIIIEDIQQFYLTEMRRIGFDNHTIKLDKNPAGELKIHFIRGLHPYAHYDVESGDEILKECTPTLNEAGVDPSKETIVLFCNMSEWNETHRTIFQNSPYYAHGTNTEGTAWQVDSPILELKYLTEQKSFVRDGQYGPISLGKYNTIFIGGIAHELGHALSLPHNAARPDETQAFGTALMGDGNRAYGDQLRGEGKGAFLTLANALRLASHPIFSSSTARIFEDVTQDLSSLKFENLGKSFTVSGKLQSSIPAYAVLAYMDPEGGGNYNATSTTTVPNPDGSFTLHCDALKAGSKGDLRLVFLFANGKATSYSSDSNNFSFPYSVADDGSVDLSVTMDKIELISILPYLKSNHPDPLGKLSADASPKAKAIAQRLVQRNRLERPLPSPDAIDLAQTQVILTDCQYSFIEVGYDTPLFDHSPSDSLFLESGRELFISGLFAHAKSSVSYELGGQWKSLTGFCGIADAAYGSVDFTILGDGKVLFQSPILEKGGVAPIKIDLTGVQKLELRTSDGGDGIRSDWSQWLDLQLHR